MKNKETSIIEHIELRREDLDSIGFPTRFSLAQFVSRNELADVEDRAHAREQLIAQNWGLA